MDIIKLNKKKFKVPVVRERRGGEIIAIGNLDRVDKMDLEKEFHEKMENAVFETKMKYLDKYYTGYSTYVYFETVEGMKLLMQNKGVLKLLKLLCERKATVDNSGYIKFRFTFGKSTYRYYIYPYDR